MLRPRRNSDEEEACGLLLAPVSQPSMESPTSGLLVLLDFSSWVTFCGLASLFPDVERLFSDRLTVVWVQWIVNELAYIKATTHSLAFSKESINVSFNTNMTKSVMSVTGDSLKYISCFIQFLQKILQGRKIKKKGKASCCRQETFSVFMARGPEMVPTGSSISYAFHTPH